VVAAAGFLAVLVVPGNEVGLVPDGGGAAVVIRERRKAFVWSVTVVMADLSQAAETGVIIAAAPMMGKIAVAAFRGAKEPTAVTTTDPC
jgi:hypothetical protein